MRKLAVPILVLLIGLVPATAEAKTGRHAAHNYAKAAVKGFESFGIYGEVTYRLGKARRISRRQVRYRVSFRSDVLVCRGHIRTYKRHRPIGVYRCRVTEPSLPVPEPPEDNAEPTPVPTPVPPPAPNPQPTPEPEPTPPPPAPSTGLIPSNAVLVRGDEYNGDPYVINTNQCPHPVPVQDGYARFERNVGDARVADGYRCEVQWQQNIAPGEHWFEYRASYPVGFAGGSGWRTGFQVHEVNLDGIGAADAAMFYEGGGFTWYGQALSRTPVYTGDVIGWHTYTVQANMQPDGSGWMRFWVDGVYIGQGNGRNMTAGGNSYVKVGNYGQYDLRRISDFDYARHYRIP